MVTQLARKATIAIKIDKHKKETVMKFNESDSTVIFDENGALGKSIHTENNTEYIRLTIQPSSSIAEHIIPIPVTFYVITGTAIMTIEGSELPITTGDLIEIEAGKPRCVSNPTEEVLELLVVKHLN